MVIKYKNSDIVWLLLDSGIIRGMVIDYNLKMKAYDVLGLNNEHYLIPGNRLTPDLDNTEDR